MALNTYSALKTSISTWLDISSTDITSIVDDLVTVGENRIFREAKTKDTEATLVASVSASVAAVPTDYQTLKFAYINTSPVKILERRSAEWLYQNYPDRTGSTVPTYVARDGGNFVFGPNLISGYTLKGVYYKILAALSGNLHNLFLNNPDLYLFACLAEADLVIGRDPRVPIWEAKYQKILNDVNNMAVNEDTSGSTLQMR